ncbi:unnamed protein product [Symbiodinium sp. CCMP2592]|nr:unnamed protein product [Symbiodinium sp. CCMP2592]
MNWHVCFKLLDGGLFDIDLSGRPVSQATLRDFATWLESELQRRRLTRDGGLWQHEGHVIAREVDVSRADLDDGSLEILLKTLARARVVVGILKLFRNELTCVGAGLLATWIQSAAIPLFELHLTHNRIEAAGALEIIQAVAENRYYPSCRPFSQGPVPLWLRLHDNDIADEESFTLRAEALIQAARPGLDRPVCYKTADYCRSHRCIMTHCPLLHLPHLRWNDREAVPPPGAQASPVPNPAEASVSPSIWEATTEAPTSEVPDPADAPAAPSSEQMLPPRDGASVGDEAWTSPLPRSPAASESIAAFPALISVSEETLPPRLGGHVGDEAPASKATTGFPALLSLSPLSSASFPPPSWPSQAARWLDGEMDSEA